MSDTFSRRVAIIDYGVGNLFSVQQACCQVGLNAQITASADEVRSAAAIILPGVGAFGEAMAALERLELVGVLRDVVATGIPFLGICLGMQLLFEESYEFGRCPGLALLRGAVVRIQAESRLGGPVKIPHVGWSPIHKKVDSPLSPARTTPSVRPSTLLEGIADGEYMYFVHSYACRPVDASIVVATSCYGNLEFCASVSYKNIFACQFHPERSGPAGLQIYRNLATMLSQSIPEESCV